MTLFVATWAVEMTERAKTEYERLCNDDDRFSMVWESLLWILKKRPHDCGAVLRGEHYIKEHRIDLPKSRLCILYLVEETRVIVEGMSYISEYEK